MKWRRGYRRGIFHGLKLTARLLGRGGMAALRDRGHRMGLWHHRMTPGKRHRLEAQIARALDLSGERSASLLREAYRVNDRAILEILAMYTGTVNKADVAQACEVDGLDHLDQALARNRGVVMLGMHMGNGVAMATHLASLGYPMAVIYRESGKIPTDFFRDGIRSMGLEAIPAVPAAVGVRRMLKALKENRVLFILMDQATKQGGIPARFMGKNLNMPPGPVELARRTGAAVVPALLTGVEPRWRFRLDPAVQVDPELELSENVGFLTEIMQRHIESEPQWWTWHQRRWARHPFADQTERD
ncbi:MAG: hypothetical protein EA370_11510 [Wenzhouxiangella sp.]|nr:MAG: hypothetical protein EA370_11510 [Wenzhouxiangella sp.]